MGCNLRNSPLHFSMGGPLGISNKSCQRYFANLPPDNLLTIFSLYTPPPTRLHPALGLKGSRRCAEIKCLLRNFTLVRTPARRLAEGGSLQIRAVGPCRPRGAFCQTPPPHTRHHLLPPGSSKPVRLCFRIFPQLPTQKGGLGRAGMKGDSNPLVPSKAPGALFISPSSRLLLPLASRE